ncbi:Glutathione S-transferase L3 isoform D [Glycine soja]|uniref:Glutathione S-transferase L3 isoform D n=1 Tax=Glycine soja TaxID=3848 RepID=A0A445LDC7_GLYSO|nr:Glutathione S-transferase L3 isoform D [Glycine soja]
MHLLDKCSHLTSVKFEGLQDKIELVPIDLKNRPAWYKEKVYPTNKVPSLEHNSKVLGESLDLIRYIDANFEGAPLFPTDPAKREFGEQLISHVDTFTSGIYPTFKGDPIQQTSAAFDYLENALGKFDDGPFFLGQFSLADIAYVSFLERFQIVFSEIFKHDITAGRPKLATWIQEGNKIDGYKQTKVDREEYLEAFKKKFLFAKRFSCLYSVGLTENVNCSPAAWCLKIWKCGMLLRYSSQ